MPITNVFLNEIRDKHLADDGETKAKVGDDNSAASASDTELGNELGEFDPISSFAGNTGEVTKIYQIKADELVGETIREVGYETYEVLQSREVVSDITKSSSEIVQIIHKTTYSEGV